MRIGIITFQRAHNFGAQMQLFALNTFLKKQGHDVFVLDYYCPEIEDHYLNIDRDIFQYFTKDVKSGLKLLIKDLLNFCSFYWRYKKIRIKGYNDFITLTYNLTKRFQRPEEMPVDFDVMITGSDQVWSYNHIGGRKEPYFLDNKLDEVKFPKRIAYAPSAEKFSYPLLIQDKEYLKKVLSKFAFISTREQSLSNLLKSEMDITSETVIDPTLLLERDDYLKIAIKPNIDYYICIYAVTGKVLPRRLANIISKERNLPIIEVDAASIATNKNESYGPLEILGFLCYADVIITSSFHGTAFSIINRKEFYSAYAQPSVRVQDLLNNLGLEDRFITNTDQYKGKSTVLYNEEKINKYVNHSKQWLLESLK